MIEIKTSNSKWILELSKCYKERTPAIIIDDAKIGINPNDQTLFEMGKKADLQMQDWIAVVVSLGVAAAGAYLLVMAILDPEPFSKIGFTIGAGVVLTMGGGFAAIKILTNTKPPKIIVSKDGSFVIEWE